MPMDFPFSFLIYVPLNFSPIAISSGTKTGTQAAPATSPAQLLVLVATAYLVKVLLALTGDLAVSQGRGAGVRFFGQICQAAAPGHKCGVE
jgi:hypothetical protein